ncbi:MAG: hypothetical protein H6686_12070 [Fibrobacteria bacterium]|nr:hypothetical protein [Fibrobacteria bacterium]
MIKHFLVLSLILVASASARRSSAIQPGFRLGARVGPSEFTPELGLAAFFGPAYVTADGWVQPWRFRTTEKDLVYYANDRERLLLDVQFRERRWGATTGLHYDVGNRLFGFVPEAGWEWSWGDWEGDLVDPPFEHTGWFGASVRILPWNHFGFKYYPEGTRSGDWKIEYVAQFGGPKRR